VATRDRGPKIVPLLDSIMASDLEDFELVVVDQSLDDATERAMAPAHDDSRLTYIRSTSTGLSRARNIAVAHTTAPLVAITDDDCIVPPEWLRLITAPLRDDPHVGVVFCSVRPVPVDEAGFTPHVIFTANRKLTTVAQAWKAGRGGLCLGAGMAVRRATFDDVGGFDGLLGAGAPFGALEDNDFSWRGLLKGWATYHTGDVTVMHDGFRNLDEFRVLVARDLFGVGGGAAKYLRTGRLGVMSLIGPWLWRFGIAEPGRDLLARRRPRGFRRPYMLIRGLIAGLRTPLDRQSLMYENNVAARDVDRRGGVLPTVDG
jgi:glycosyltransferase involved in cell wall biosynthesis